MSGIGSIIELEKITQKNSVLHALDGRVKLVILIALIVYAVYTTDLIVLALMEIYLTALISVSHLSLKDSFMKILLILPFGGAIAVFQPFIHPGTIIYTLPLGISVTSQGLTFGILLMSRLVVSLTCIVLLSSLSPMQEVVDSFKKLGMPRDLAMIFSLFIRYLFMFYDELERIRNAQKSRNFDIFNRKTAYLWRVKQVAYTIAMMFLRAFEKGETAYFSMLSRGYSEQSEIYSASKKLESRDFIFIGVTIALILGLEFMKFSSLI
ncbi:cobalt ECF transporter T component CbiQ [Methanobacterium paludis]|uniref:Cobalt ABC transporter, inner membrane subunit CbiQ n=1 Tax=Methanobacterium paludis (strain DSM 25820 / JCM 18151 / SWAN1) TaxID=868131 RepID=F6D6V4_METPW|nr:cobalt ECF transporter T component CbiQ [Methanobacterium paludis]AEG18992.1 cobalt ABC transporter, inner membrane subunit CbiQ [Methanobacterium paludis]